MAAHRAASPEGGSGREDVEAEDAKVFLVDRSTKMFSALKSLPFSPGKSAQH